MLSSGQWIGIATMPAPYPSRRRSPLGYAQPADTPFPARKVLVLPTALSVCAQLVAERANRNSQDACRVSAVAVAMLHCVYDQVAFDLRDRLSDEGGKPECSARLSARGASSRRSTKVACWLPHLTPSKAVVFAEAHCRGSRWSKLDRFRSEFVTVSREPVTRVNHRSHSADGLTAWDASLPAGGGARCRGSDPRRPVLLFLR